MGINRTRDADDSGADDRASPPPRHPRKGRRRPKASILAKSSSPRRSAPQALADIPMSVSVLRGETLERQQADNFQDLVVDGAGPQPQLEHARRHAHHAARHQYRRCRLDGRRLRQRRAVRLEQRPRERRDPLRRLRHLRHGADRSAARPAGHALRRELTRRRDQVRRERPVHRRLRGTLQGVIRRPSKAATSATP